MDITSPYCLEAGYFGQRPKRLSLRVKVTFYLLNFKGIRMQGEDSTIVVGDCQCRPDQPTDWDLY